MGRTQTVTSRIEQDEDELRVRVTLLTETTGDERDGNVVTTTFLTVDAMMRYRDELDRRINQAHALGAY